MLRNRAMSQAMGENVLGRQRRARSPFRAVAFRQWAILGSVLALSSISGGSGEAIAGHATRLDVAATYFGGSGEEVIMDVAVHPSGDVLAAGWSDSSRIPLGDGEAHEGRGGFDAFVLRMDAGLSELISVVFLAGKSDDRATTLAVAPDGTVVVGGLTSSADFPVSEDAFDPSLDGFCDGFIAIVDTERDVPEAQRLVYSTLIGGAGEDACVKLKVAASGLVSAVGFTDSGRDSDLCGDFPTTPGAYQECYQGGRWDSFLLQLRVEPEADPEEQLVYSTFLGGTDADAFLDDLLRRIVFQDMTLDDSGVVTIVNVTNSTDFPVTEGAFQTVHGGGRDAYVVQIAPDPDLGSNQLQYGTFLGGGPANDGPQGVEIDRDGNIVVAGWTWNSGFPTTENALDRSFNGPADAFLSVLAPDLGREPALQLVYSTLIGGSGQDFASALAVDANGTLLVSGVTTSVDFPVGAGNTIPIQRQLAGVVDSFLAVLAVGAKGDQLLYSTYFGGTAGEEWDDTNAIALDQLGRSFLAGVTDTCSLLVDGASFQSECGGGKDGYVMRLGRLSGPPPFLFRRGDCNDNGNVDISDAVFSLGSLFLGDGDPGCDDACDSNDDGTVDISDAIATLGVLFLGNGVIPLPGMTGCGVDPTEDEIGCMTFNLCP